MQPDQDPGVRHGRTKPAVERGNLFLNSFGAWRIRESLIGQYATEPDLPLRPEESKKIDDGRLEAACPNEMQLTSFERKSLRRSGLFNNHTRQDRVIAAAACNGVGRR